MIYKFVLLTQCLLSVCLCELSIERKDKLLNDFIVYYNNLPNQLYTCDEGVLQNAQQTDDNTYKIDVNLKVASISNLDAIQFMRCTATIQDSQSTISVLDNDMKCEEKIEEGIATIDQPTDGQVEVTEPTVQRKPVQLDNEIQANTAATSGEQFIAIPRERPSTPCVGCSSHVNPQAAGVSDLASLGVRHLDKHEPAVKHSLDTILDVERQVQVVNGVRYILTLLINFNSCTDTATATDTCTHTRACKISVLDKPWIKLPNGSKYRAILANNCTEEWQYGDDGEVLPEDSDDNRAHNQIDSHPSKDDGSNDDIKVVHNSDVQSLPNQEKILTEAQVRDIEEQIIPKKQLQQAPPKTENHGVVAVSLDSDISKQNVGKDESVNHNSENSLGSADTAKQNTKAEHASQDKSTLSQDKKQAIDDMLHFFDFSGFKPNSDVDETKPRMKRSYDYDLQVLSLAENYQDIKKRLENAKFVYNLAQEMVDYLNEMDMTVKDRVLKNVLKAEEEFENYQHFLYIQALVTIPCDKAECEPVDTVTKICNGVIDSTNKDKPQVLNTFCHKDHKEKPEIGTDVPSNDPVLQHLVKTAIKKIEIESSSAHGIRLNRIVSANTRQASGTLTKISIMIDYINCNKTVPYLLKKNCTVLEQLGSRICEVIVHERHWLKEKKMSYTCTDVPIDVSMSKEKLVNENKTNDDPKIWEMLREALQQLEIQSNRNNKQKIVKINSVSSQIIAGFLTKIEFLVGYTTCNNEYVLHQPSKVCELLPNERLRKCLAQFWDRSWIEDGKQMEVACDDDVKPIDNDLKNNNDDTTTEKSGKTKSVVVEGKSEHDVDDPQYKALALESLQKFMKTSSSRQHYDVSKIVYVTTQSLAGTLTEIEFEISPTNCQLGRNGAPSSSNCKIINPENTYNCDSKVLENPWLNYKDINVTCQINDENSRLKRAILVGGPMEHNPKESKFMKLAEKSLQKYRVTSGVSDLQSLRLVSVDKVTTQVVAGVLTTLNFTVSIDEHSDNIKCYSKIWDRPWITNESDIQVTCNIDQQRSRTKRQLGGRKERDPTDPKYLNLAEQSLQKYLMDVGNTNSYRVGCVTKVTTQVVAGTLTRIDFEVSQLNDNDSRICHAEIWERKWLNKKDINVTCVIDDQTNQKQNVRTKRDTLPGGKTKQNASDTEYKNLAKEALNKYVSDTGNTGLRDVIGVKEVYTQVVSGLKTYINFEVSQSNNDDVIICDATIWEQKWLNKKEITVTCVTDDETTQKTNIRTKRDTLVGGKTKQNASDTEYKNLAKEALNKYVSDTGNTGLQDVIGVKEVYTQVVSGLKTYINFEVSQSNNDDVISCDATIWEQKWLNKKEITVTCVTDDETTQKTNIRTKRDTLVGGKTKQNASDTEYKNLAKEALNKYVSDTGNTGLQDVIGVKEVYTQVVSGLKTYINFEVSQSNNDDVISCDATIWEQKWLNKKEITVTCVTDDETTQKTNIRTKRDTLVGGNTKQNASDTGYKNLAKEALNKYVSDTGNTGLQDVIGVKEVYTQVVSGVKTYINFEVSQSNNDDVIICDATIWEQKWLNKKEITVTCVTDDETTQNTNIRTKRDTLVGGKTKQNASDTEYKNLAKEALNKYVSDTGNTGLQDVIGVKEVYTQVVSGLKTYINFEVSQSNNDDVISCDATIWEQKWLNKKEITVTCVTDDETTQKTNIRTKRDTLLGGKTKQNASDTEYKNLAKEALNKYVSDTGNTGLQDVIGVKEVYTQVVSGVKTYINFEVSQSNNDDVISCDATIWEQKWLNKKEITVTCVTDDETTQKTNIRTKRDTLVGGKSKQNASDPEYKNLAKEALNKYVSDTGNTGLQDVIGVKEVYTQVVSGVKTYINFEVSQSNNDDVISCDATIWEQKWLNKKEITVTCVTDDETTQKTNIRTKRDTLVGEKTKQNASDTEYKNLAKEALNKYVSDTGNTGLQDVIGVKEVYTQVVSGVKTYINFEVSQSNNDDVISCDATIWEQKWHNKKEIDVRCTKAENFRAKMEIFGDTGKSKHTKKNNKRVQNPKDKQYYLLAEESLREYERLKSDGVNHRVVEVKHVVTQVASGMIYMIDYIATPTTCSANTAGVDCSKDNNPIMHCHTKIWSMSWLRSKEIDVTCYSDNGDADYEYENDDSKVKPKVHQRSSTGMLGAPETKDVDAPKYKKLAEETLQTYLTKSNIKFTHKVTKIHSVTEQVVEGMITKIEYSISPTSCLREDNRGSENNCEITKPQVDLLCTAEVLDRPQSNEKDINVDCEPWKHGKRVKRKANYREKRQSPNDDDYVDDELKYYYANRAVQHVNEQSRGGHLHKLVTIHAIQHSVQMKTTMVRMYIELAETFCLRHQDELDLQNCEEMDGLNHKLCLARLWPSPDDELVVRHTSVICDDEDDFESISGLHISDLLVMSINEYERSPQVKFKTVHQGEPHIVPSLDSKVPVVINFLLATTNCTKNVNLTDSLFECYIDISLPTKACTSYIWLMPNGKSIKTMTVSCSSPTSRTRRSASDASNTTTDDMQIQTLVTAALEKLEMESLQRYKQRVLQINSHSTKITSGKVTTIDFDVGYTACLKYEWVENVTSCDFLEHLPRRHCVAQIWERLWLNNGRNIDVRCEDDETPLEAHIEFESAEMAMALARAALKHIEAKYPHPRKQKVVRIFSLEKQVVAGVHYRMKIEVGLTDCMALSERSDCKIAEGLGINKFCRVNVWIRPWTDHPPNYRVSCDYQEGATTEMYRNIQAEHLFYDFITTNNPTYINDHAELRRRFDIFKANVRKIHELNIYEMGTARYGVTRFADLTYEEFQTKYTGLKPSLRDPNRIPMSKARIPLSKIPESFDWRDYDAVTEVKDQGSCGSCWAFSVTGNIEGQWKMQSGQLVSLSEQELVDCDKMDEGCNGGLMDNAYRAVEELGGLETETDYPYEGEDDKCSYNRTLSKVQISGAVNISSNETEMAMWLLHNGPISIGINANAMQFYMGGISHPWKMLCNPTNLDHGVLIVGYGAKDYPLFHKHLPYWIVKNSWGKSWGEQGYYRVYRGDGTCGVNKMASSAVV